MLQQVVLFWFRRDLRLDDNAALYQALSSGLAVVPVFIFDSDILSHLEDKDDNRLSFIYAALEHLQKQLVSVKSTLDVRYGKPLETFEKLLQDYQVQAVYANHDYEPYAEKRDEAVKKLLTAKGIGFHTQKDQVILNEMRWQKKTALATWCTRLTQKSGNRSW